MNCKRKYVRLVLQSALFLQDNMFSCLSLIKQLIPVGGNSIVVLSYKAHLFVVSFCQCLQFFEKTTRIVLEIVNDLPHLVHLGPCGA